MRDAIAADALPLPLRVAAGAQPARHGDPRDLEALCDAPGGAFVMGARTHPTSTPPHRLAVARFRIGRFAVVNRVHARFVAETGRAWRSEDGLRAVRRQLRFGGVVYRRLAVVAAASSIFLVWRPDRLPAPARAFAEHLGVAIQPDGSATQAPPRASDSRQAATKRTPATPSAAPGMVVASGSGATPRRRAAASSAKSA